MYIRPNAEIFRRNPKLMAGLGAILLCIGIAGFLDQYHDYKTLGTIPQELTIEQAVSSPSAIPDAARFVSFSTGLSPDCGQVLEETTNGTVTGRIVLASDSTRQRWFAVHLKDNKDCSSASGPTVGILKKAASGLPGWLKDKGMDVPASSYPLMDFSVDDGPGDVLLLLGIFSAMGFGGLGTILYLLRLEPKPAVHPAAMGHAVGR